MRSFGPNEMFYIVLAARWTLLLAASALAGGVLFGALLTAIGLARNAIARHGVTIFVQFVQGTPLLIVLLLTYFGLSALGFDLGALLSSALALTLYAGAYFSTIWRGAIGAVGSGQWEGAAALGLNRWFSFRFVIFPQALRMALAPTCGFTVQLIKNTSLAALVGFVELTRAGQIASNATFQPLLAFGVVAVAYFVMCLPFTLLSEWLEHRHAHP
ncbi:amino acid ABC transporter permease [Bosea sp. PAMC 26642]|uniref:amino acid ABC transporter permease n=1 Tax=Bosea sp. (strain PAMC 26642) TaxID=1792307 RepID=UPI000770171F|nr:amino acid ABC transporter permease [Bosea sp. PAMC 26642]AMJ61495.1 amino acid ABC transporter permease [Bosea sp. PAMC 26642]